MIKAKEMQVRKKSKRTRKRRKKLASTRQNKKQYMKTGKNVTSKGALNRHDDVKQVILELIRLVNSYFP